MARTAVTARATRFPLFDSLRAIAALAVLGTHVGVVAHLYTGHSDVGRFAARLEVGVAVFFLISGFLLYRPFVRARMLDQPRPTTGAYAWRRFLRIAPAYWVALTLVAIWFGRFTLFTASAIPTHYGLVQNYTGVAIASPIVQAWTLCIEVAFYALLPLYAVLMRALPGSTWTARVRTEIGALAVLFLIGAGWKLVALSGGNPNNVVLTPELLSLPAYFDQFALGMGLAVLSVWLERREELPRVLAPLDRFPSLSWGVALVAFWVVSTQIGLTARFFEPATRSEYLLRHFLFALIALTLIAPAVIGDQRRGVLRRLLANRALLYLGLISYGIYLYGGAVATQLADWKYRSLVPDDANSGIVTFALWALPALAGTVILGTISYYVLERRALSLKRLFGPREPAPGEAIGEPTAVSAPPAQAG
jgi:peptidoglycan/LPS O-acetylase OafA/YrhL